MCVGVGLCCMAERPSASKCIYVVTKKKKKIIEWEGPPAPNEQNIK